MTGEDQPRKSPAAESRSGVSARFMGAGMPAERSENFSGTVKRLIDTMGPARRWAWVVIVLSVISVSCLALGPWILGRATNVIVDGLMSDGMVDTGRLGGILAVAVVLYLIGAGFAFTQARLLAHLVHRTMFRLRSDVEDKLNRVPLKYIDGQPRGDLLSRVTNDIDNVQQSLQQTLSQVLSSSLTIVAVVIMMFVISPLLAVIALVTIPTSLVAVRLITAQSKKRFVAQWAHTGTLNSQVEETFTGHALVKVFGQTEQTERTFAEENDKLFVSSFWAQFISGSIQPAMMFFGNLNFVAIAVIGGLRVESGAMTIGAIQAFIQYSRQFTQPLTQLASMMNVLQSGIASAERVFELLDAPEESPDPVDPAVDTTPHGHVVFDDVEFSYDPDVELIRDLSLTAPPGTTVAIVGPTGAGKTTLVNLLMRFYDIDGGRITLDGVDTMSMTRHDVREQMGMVLQDTWLFNGTIRENIAYGDLEATEDEILAAARATYVDRFVRALPDGYDTMVDDERGGLSAGEKQLITIARAFLAKPTILILDEATSSVDTRTEVLIQRAMAALRTDRTSFVIAHRLSTIRDADAILVMEAGHIVEQGSHDELLAANGAYAALYRSQFQAPAAEVG